MKRFPLAVAGMVLSLALAGEAAAQDVTPPMSQDTSKADKVRTDTMRADTTLGYRPMQGQNPCVVPVEVARAQDAARQEPGRDMARVDTMGPAEIRRDSIPGEPAPKADSLAKAPGAIQEQQADGRQANDSLRTGVIADSVQADSAKVSEVAFAGAVNCDTMGKLAPDAPVDTAQARQLPGLMGPPAQSDTGAAVKADSAKAADKPKED
ncbi:MAG TPA: hypothetical protein VFT04_10760 [Gemmatimonadales bacterium]|nr:hypothetical protein [Gemmatimonadales bacterium]